jgi:hypothetical protein
MQITRILLLAGMAALSLSGGAAKAQNLTPSFAEAPYQAGLNRAASATFDRANGQFQSGSSDTGLTRPGASHGATFLSNHHLFGVGGAGG